MPAFTWIPGEATIVAVLELARELVKADEVLMASASDEQKRAIIQWRIDAGNWLRDLVRSFNLQV